jgi:hypothetical protein
MSQTVQLATITTPEFTATPRLDAEVFKLELTGNADVAAIAPLTEMLVDLHGEITRVGARQVVVDFTQLEFMNSSCFKSFVTWISAALDSPSPYKVTFRSNQTMLWQRRSLHALSAFATDLIAIETT